MLVNNFDVGGLENIVLSLLNNLDDKRFQLYVVCLNGEGAQFNQVSIPADRCLVLNKRLVNLGFGSVDLFSLHKIHKFIVKNRIQLIHAHNAAPLIYAGFGRLFLKKRPLILYTEHNQIYSASNLSRRKFKYYINYADHIVAISRNLQNELEKTYKVRCPITLIYNGIDGTRFLDTSLSTVRRELGIAEEKTVFGCGVVLSTQKGLEFLLNAVYLVKDQIKDAQFVIAGDGPLREQLEMQVKELQIADFVQFIGYRSDMPAVIQALDVYILPSLWEGLPLALIEAMAMGKPIICTSVGGNPEIVLDGENGLVVHPGKPVPLSEAILKLSCSAAERNRISLNNRSRFEEHFSQAAMIDGHEALYEKLLR